MTDSNGRKRAGDDIDSDGRTKRTKDILFNALPTAPLVQESSGLMGESAGCSHWQAATHNIDRVDIANNYNTTTYDYSQFKNVDNRRHESESNQHFFLRVCWSWRRRTNGRVGHGGLEY